jgi:uncharacterized OB-fold protein
MVFAIVFGLSMDYEVFLVSRIHEEWQHRGDASAAVREGLANTGRVRTFTIVHRAAPGVPTPYVSAVVDLEGGGSVKANLLNVEPDPAHVQFGMPVRLTTFVAGTDDNGTEAIAFAYEPA